MKMLKLVAATCVAVMMTLAAEAAKTAKAVVKDGGATLRFVYDETNYGTKDTDWFSVAEAEAQDPNDNPPWHGTRSTVTKVVFDESFAAYRPTQCGRWFYEFEHLSMIENIGNLDTSVATSFAFMFGNCSSLTMLDLSDFDTANVTDMSCMFYGCSELTALDVSGFDTSKVTDMSYMFNGCSALKSLNLSGFDTSNVTNMNSMFYDCSELTALDVSGFDTSKVTNMWGMFSVCSKLTVLDLTGFDTAKVTNMACMFQICSSLESIFVSDGFVTTGVTVSGLTFSGCTSLKGGAGTVFDRTKTDATYARIDGGPSAPGYFSQLIAKVVVEDGGATLRFVYDNLDYGPKGTNWFSVAEAEAIDPFSDSAPWEELGETVTKVVFDSSFAGYRPVQCGSWFYNFEWLSQIEGIGNLKTSSATGMAYMFSGCSSLTSLDLSGFDTAQVTSMNSMFSNCSSLKSLNLSGFDTAKVKDTLWMFNGCRSLTTIYASDAFVTGGITESGAMFASCSALKGGVGTAYDSTKQDKAYARIDGGAAAPGYFTAVTSFAKVVVENGGTTLRFAYDELGYGEKDVDWYSLADAEAIVDPDSEDVPWAARGGSVTKVVFDKSFADYRPSQCSCWFWNFGKLVTIDGLWNLDTSSATSLAYMFGKCSKLVTLDLSGFDTSLVTNMSGLFRDCTSLTTIYASEKFVTAQVTQSSGVFYQCDSLVGGNGTPFDSGSIAYARIDAPGEPGYFTAVPLIAKVVVEDDGATLRFVYDDLVHGEKDVDWFSVAEAEAKNPSVNPAWHDLAGSVTRVVFDRSFADYRPTHCGNWFNGFGNLEKINGLKNLDTSDATSMIAMFYGCSSLTSLDLSTFDTSEVTSMNQMFEECSSLVSLDLTGFDTAKVTGMGYMFLNCSSLTTIFASDSFVTTAVSFPVGMFDGCTSIMGGMGTTYDDTKYGTACARIDGGPSAPGYFTRAEIAAKVVVEDGGATLRFVCDRFDYGTKGMDWFSVAEAEAIDPRYDDVPWYGKRSTVTKVVFADSFKDYQPTQCGSWFYNFENLATIVDIGNLDTSKVTDMLGMFYGCSALTTLDVTGFDTSKVTDMGGMFYGCSKLTTLDVTGFDTSKVTDMVRMFEDCSSLAALDVTGFDTAKVTNMHGMFSGCSSLTTLDVTGFDTTKVTDMSDMFNGCSSLTALDVSGFDTSKVTNMWGMFSVCSKLTVLDLTGFDTAKVTNMACMFQICSSLESIFVSDGFVTTGVEVSGLTFSGCTSLKGGAGTVFDSTKTDATYARIDGGPSAPGYFTRAEIAAKVVVEDGGKTLRFVYDGTNYGTKGTDWFSVAEAEAIDPRYDDVPWYGKRSTVTKVVFDPSFAAYRPKQCGSWFYDFGVLAAVDGLKNLNTSVTTNMAYMFYGCSSLTTLDVSGFDTANVTSMCNMFENCSSLTSLDVTGFDTANVTSMCNMFEDCSSLTTLDVSGFDTANVTAMYYMFFGCSSLTSLDVSGFDTSKVTDMAFMFGGCSSLEAICVSDRFVTDQVSNSYSMFKNCSKLVGGAGTAYDSTKTDKTYARIDGGAAVPGYFTAVSASAKVVVEDGGATLRFVYDKLGHGEKDVDWFSVAEAEAIDPYSEDVPWYGKRSTVTKVVFDESFAAYRPTQCGRWFYGFENLATIEDIGNLDTSAATSFAYMFQKCSSLTTLDVTGFDTAKVSSMNGMFVGCSSLTTLDVTGFDTSKVTKMGGMFYGCSKLTALDVTGFDTAKVTTMAGMFSGCSSLTSLDIAGFDTSKVTYMWNMFSDCSSLTSLNLSGFNTSQVTEMEEMFFGCSVLGTIVVSDKFVTTAVLYSWNMFDGCSALVGGAGTAYDSTKTDATYARIDGGASAPGYFTLKSVGGYAAWAAAKGLTGADAAWDAKPAMWGGKWENAFVYTFGEELADGSLAIMSIAFDVNGKPVITTAPVVEGHTDFTPAVIGTPNLQNWSSPVVLENKSGDDWTLPVGAAANFFRVRLSK